VTMRDESSYTAKLSRAIDAEYVSASTISVFVSESLAISATRGTNPSSAGVWYNLVQRHKTPVTELL